MIEQRLYALRALMRAHNMDAYLIPTADYHGSEYVGEHFKAREFLSGFTGSSGTLIVTQNEAALFTDGRYFLQAERELSGSDIRLMRMDEPGVPTIESYLEEILPENGVLGLDGRTIFAADALALERQLRGKCVRIACEEDLVGQIWNDRPPLTSEKAFLLSERYCGRSAREKLADVRGFMEIENIDAHLIASLEEIAWLFNLRGNDIRHNPVVLAYALIERDGAALFIDRAKLDAQTMDAFAALGVSILPYGDVYDFLAAYREGARVLLSMKAVNYMLYSSIVGRADIIDEDSPILHKKVIKNATEIENLHTAHRKDAAAMIKLICFLKTRVGEQRITEMDVARLSGLLRLEQQGCLGPSFSAITGYKEHSAIVHYHAKPEIDKTLEPEGFLLIDSGGQYYEGTTDITRTIALGPLTEAQKRHFTLVLKGMLALSGLQFLKGCHGFHIDVMARAPLWAQGLDYKHGTGHGIGYLLCVHEPPVSVRWRMAGKSDVALEPGMVLSDEPGVYIPGEYGIRIENQLLVELREQNEYGQFLGFETLSLVPIDLDAVDIALLTQYECAALNAYHARVYEYIAPLLNEVEREWLKEATRTI